MKWKKNRNKVLANAIIKTAGRCVGLTQQAGESILLFGKRVAAAHGVDRKSFFTKNKGEIADVIRRARQKTHPELHDEIIPTRSSPYPLRKHIDCGDKALLLIDQLKPPDGVFQ